MHSARVCDPLGPWWMRALGASIAAALALPSPLVLALGWFASGSFLVGMLVAVASIVGALMLPAWLGRPRPPMRDAVVSADDDAITVRDAGVLSQRLSTRDVTAASIARDGDGFSIALERRWSGPLVLQLRSQQAIDDVRRALHLPRDGAGTTTFNRTAGAVALGMAGASVGVGAGLCTGELSAVWPLCALGFVVGASVFPLFREPHRRANLALSPDGVTVRSVEGARVLVPYRAVTGVAVAGGTELVVEMGSATIRTPLGGLTEEERAHVVACIEQGAARARSTTTRVEGVASALDLLAPKGEATAEWIARVDATAGALSATDAYRRPNLGPLDLWSALASPDVAPPIRAAAARVLARVAPEDAAQRIAGILETERDPRARAMIEVALEEDVSDAAAHFDAIARR